MGSHSEAQTLAVVASGMTFLGVGGTQPAGRTGGRRNYNFLLYKVYMIYLYLVDFRAQNSSVNWFCLVVWVGVLAVQNYFLGRTQELGGQNQGDLIMGNDLPFGVYIIPWFKWEGKSTNEPRN